MRTHRDPDLTRRERQIMEVLFRRGPSTASEVQESLPERLSNSTVRTLLKVLETKGHITHKRSGKRFVFTARVRKRTASRQALRQLLHTYFDGSAGKAAVALLDDSAFDLSRDELDRLSTLIGQALRKEE